MKNKLLLVLSVFAFTSSFSQSNIPPAEVQIKLAMLAAPADKKDGATIYGYAPNKDLVVLRKGTNEMVCLADDPTDGSFSVACYHRDLEPFMQRGRDLKKEGKPFEEIFNTREKEVKEGKLKMPLQPTTLFVYSASKKDYNDTTGTVNNGYLRYVVYIPYATAESTGLPVKPEGPAMPWIMYPGTHSAHIMINPPKN